MWKQLTWKRCFCCCFALIVSILMDLNRTYIFLKIRFQLTYYLKLLGTALAGVAQRIEHQPRN